MSLTRTLIRHAPTDYSSLFVRGLPASLDADDVRRYFSDRGYKCTVSFNKINNEYYKLYVALQFETEKMAREVYNKYDNEQVLGYNVGLSFYKDKARLYRDFSDSRMRKARVGQPVDKRRFNRTPSPPSPRSSRRRRSRSRSRSRSRRSHSHHSRRSDSDRSRSRSRSRSHSGSSSPKRRNRSSSRDRRKKSRTRSFSRSPSRHSWSPKNSRTRSKSPKQTDNSKHRKSLSPEGSSRKRRSSRPSLSPSHSTKREPRSPSPIRSSRTRSPSPIRSSRTRSPSDHSPTRRSRKRTSSQTSSASSDRSKTPQESGKRKSSLSPTKNQIVPSPTHSRDSSHSRDESPAKKIRSDSAERTLPDDQLPDDQQLSDHDSKEVQDKPKEKSKKKKESRRRGSSPEGSAARRMGSSPEGSAARRMGSSPEGSAARRMGSSPEGSAVSPERQSEVPPKATTLSTSIYGKVGSFTDMNIQQASESSSSSDKGKKDNGKVPNGGKSKSAADPEDVEADLRAEFLNNNDALYDSHERAQSAAFPLVSRKKAENILDDLPIDPLRESHQYVSSTVERNFTLSNGDEDGKGEASSKDVWTPEMLTKLKVKKEEIIQAYKQDCDTFSTVVRMLISKDAELESRLQHALRENLKEIGQRCVQELHQLADTLKTEAK